ncbi:MAG: response regulator transcription factor [Cryobacterium sp.]|nr:response regulator transcription factor [Oligoflexia bacterium]
MLNSMVLSAGGVAEIMTHLWVLEDDEDAIILYQKMFQSGFEAEYFKSLNDLRSAITVNGRRPELLIADLHLPDGEFTTLLGGDSAALDMPFAVVSASDDYKILQDCFKKGARDFFVKPVNRNEILFKINRILNEKSQPASALSKPQFKDLTLDTFTQTVSRENSKKVIQLTQTEYKILALFFRNPDRRLNREEIIGEVWKSEALSPKAFDFHLSKLREKLRDLTVKINYQTNEGYCLLQE